jgi:hypothetical protein
MKFYATILQSSTDMGLVRTKLKLKNAQFLHVKPYSLVEIFGCFGGISTRYMTSRSRR